MKTKNILNMSLITLTILMCFWNYNTVTVQAGAYSIEAIDSGDTVYSGDVLQILSSDTAFEEILLTYVHPNGTPLSVSGGIGPSSNVLDLTPPHPDHSVPGHYNEYEASVSITIDGYGDVYLSIILKGIAAPPPSASPTPRPGLPASSTCEHDLEWETIAEPTKDAEGLMAYVCKKCGAIDKYQHYGAYATYNLQLIDQMTNAAADSTVTLTTTIWESFTQEVMRAIAGRRDLTVILRYRIKGQDYEIIIPAGAVVPTDVDYAGFDAYLAGLYGKQAI